MSNLPGKEAPIQPHVVGQVKAIHSQQTLGKVYTASDSDPRKNSNGIHYTQIVIPRDLL